MNSFEELTQNVSKLESEAWDWIIRLDSEEPMTAREKAQFSEWLSRSPSHAEHIREINGFWTDSVLAQVLLSEHEPAKAELAKPTFSLFRPVYAIVACAFIMVLSGVYWVTGTTSQAALNNAIYVTAIGEQQDIKLADGSHILLNSDSQAKVSYSDKARNIWLIKGEAHFEVAKNKERPFNVYAANGRVQAVGTAFTVDLSTAGKLDVLVTEGKIALALANPDKSNLDVDYAEKSLDMHISYQGLMENIAFMTVGEYTSINSNVSFSHAKQSISQNISKLNKNDFTAKLAWQSGEIVFTGQTLAQVIEQLKRYSPMKIELGAPELANIRIGGRFRIDHMDSLFDNLEANFDLQIHKIAMDKIVIDKQGS